MTQTPRSMTDTPHTTTRDPIALVGQVLDLVRLNGAIFFRADFSAPWCYSSPATDDLEGALPPVPGSLVMFHIVVRGDCWIEMRDGTRHELGAGDIVVMPYGDAHSFGSTEQAPAVPITDLLPPPPWTEFPGIRYGGGGPNTFFVCGYLRGDAVLFDPVLRALPSVFVVHPPAGPVSDWVSACVEYAMHASDGAVMANPRIPELLFTEVLRLYLTEQADAHLTGWLAALRDPIVGPALVELHADPARDWTVTELARAVVTSRSVLAERFLELLGRPPIRYLSDWRLKLASGLLRTTDQTVSEIGAHVGYNSEEVFSRAFKRAFGKAPAHWRAEVA